MPEEHMDNNDPQYEPQGQESEQAPVEGEEAQEAAKEPDFETSFASSPASQNSRFNKIQADMINQNAADL